MQTVVIRNHISGAEIGDRIEYAANSLTRLVGLLGRSTLTAGEGLWIDPSSGVHTIGMRFAIDVVGLDRSMRVIKVWQRLKPQRVTSISTNVRSVLELAAGEIDARSIRLGDVLRATPAQR
ncbi:DUF192 domain-containing protein [Granulicella sibirica]|uniref:DUF192 domain-containing protein n=1 Tax=Granulicella sibirica TaxID=2479048 RepID=UPI001008E9CE|nr:DUF192 domain-containing protein [Granulicella sibirica]